MTSISVRIMTPQKILFEGSLTALIAPGKEGYFEILVNHAPLSASLKKGTLTLIHPDKKRTLFSVTSGFLTVEKNELDLLLDEAIPIEVVT